MHRSNRVPKGNRWPIYLCAGILLAALLPLAAANHPQPIHQHEDTPSVTFDHLVGNEWWVEVRVTTSSPDYPVDDVWATDDGVTWHRLALRSWGAWAGSFHIEPGNEVMFRASQTGGMSDVWSATSCWFAHPAGAPERCSDFDANFRDTSGNEWWQQIYVSGNDDISRVDVSINGNTWKPLSLRSWGAWAGSYYAPGGSIVQFRAVSDTGAVDNSGCYYWTLATPAECEQPDFDVSFRNMRGNQYWVETDVIVMRGALSTVAFQYETNAGTSAWMPMKKTSWGSWAASTNVPAGAVVQFRATSTDGQTDLSDRFLWPPR